MNAAHPDYRRLKKINECYQDSMRLAKRAVEFDEKDENNAAVDSYLKCLQCIEDGVAVDIKDASYNGSEWNDARNQQQKMLQLEAKFKDRLYFLQQHQSGGDPTSSVDLPAFSHDVPDGHVSLDRSKSCEPLAHQDFKELLTIPGGVQLFFVSEDDHVATTPPSYPTFLRVLINDLSGGVFIQVNVWKYPIVSGRTPVLKTNSGIYLFPNLDTNTITAGSVGIVISSEVDESLIDTFECVLSNLAVFQKQKIEDDIDFMEDEAITLRLRDFVKVPTSDAVAAGLGKGAEWFRSGISKAGTFTSDAIKKTSEGVKGHLVPNDNPTPISPAVQTSLYYAHEASKATLAVSKYLVTGLCALTSKVGEELAPHIKKVLPENGGTEDSVVDGVVKVTGAGLSGLGTVWTELERSGIAIANAVSKATVENVQFKYGRDAGLATSNAMGTFVNVGKTAFNLDNLGIKTIAKRTAKDTGRAVLKEYEMKKDTMGSAV